MKEYKTILVLVGPGCGDVILSSPIINGLRNNYPNAVINTLALVHRTKPGLSEGHRLLPGLCKIDNMIEIDERFNIAQKSMVFIQLMKHRYDLIVNLWPNTHNKTFFANLIKRGESAGFSKEHDIYILPKNEQKVILENKLLNKITGKKNKIMFPKYPYTFKKKNMITVSVSRDDDPLRSWPVNKWAQLLNQIHEKYRCHILLLGADVNKGRIEQITRMVNFTPLISLNEFDKLQWYIANAKLHLTENCGIMHIASTTDTPIISISQSAPGWAPYGKGHIELRGKTMNDINGKDVWKKIQIKLRRKNGCRRTR